MVDLDDLKDNHLVEICQLCNMIFCKASKAFSLTVLSLCLAQDIMTVLAPILSRILIIGFHGVKNFIFKE